MRCVRLIAASAMRLSVLAQDHLITQQEETTERKPRSSSSEQEMEEWEREEKRPVNGPGSEALKKNGSSNSYIRRLSKTNSQDDEFKKRAKAEKEREKEKKKEEKLKKKEEKRMLKESRDSLRGAPAAKDKTEKEDKILKKTFSSYPIDSEERPVCPNVHHCNVLAWLSMWTHYLSPSRV